MAAAVVLVGGGAVAAVTLITNGGTSASAGAPAAAAAPDKPDPGAAAAVQSTQEELAASLTLSAQWGATAVPWGTPITLTSTMGDLSLVQVTNASGAPVAGTLEPGGHTWKLTGTIVPSGTYHVSATVTRPDGMSAERSGTFTMAPPAVVVSATVFPSDGLQVGVGQPIVVNFDHDINGLGAQQSVVSHLVVAMSKPVPGGWYWFSPTELHFRPTNYWPSGEQVTLTGNLNGWDAGGGRWGAGTLVDSFSVGAPRISVANLATHEMTVTLNGAVVATYPLSGGPAPIPDDERDAHRARPRERGAHGVLDGRYPRQLPQRL